jgi:hypothetical protein
MLSILLNFIEFKTEIMNHINEIIDDINIFDFFISSFKVNLDDDLLFIILLKFFSKKSNLQDERILDNRDLSKYLLEKMIEFENVEKVKKVQIPARLDFQPFKFVELYFNDKTGSDFTIISNSTEFYCHKSILSNYNYFKTLFNSNYENNIYEINHISPEVMSLIIKLLYNGTVKVPENINLLEEMFDFFNMIELDMIDILHLLNKLNTYKSPQNVSFLFNVYFKHSKIEYKKEINEFWITFYDSLLKFIKKEKNFEIFFELLEKFSVHNSEFFKKILSFIIDKNEKNNSQIIELFVKLDRKQKIVNDEILNQLNEIQEKNEKNEKIQKELEEKNEKLQKELYDLQNKLKKNGE